MQKLRSIKTAQKPQDDKKELSTGLSDDSVYTLVPILLCESITASIQGPSLQRLDKQFLIHLPILGQPQPVCAQQYYM